MFNEREVSSVLLDPAETFMLDLKHIFFKWCWIIISSELSMFMPALAPLKNCQDHGRTTSKTFLFLFFQCELNEHIFLRLQASVHTPLITALTGCATAHSFWKLPVFWELFDCVQVAVSLLTENSDYINTSKVCLTAAHKAYASTNRINNVLTETELI